MKIRFDYRIFISQQFGGISRLFVVLFSYLKVNTELDIKFLVLVHFNNYLKKINVENLIFLTKINKVYYHLAKLLNKFYEQISLILFPPDIFHMTYYGKIPFHLKKTKVVITVYDMIHELYPNQFSEKSRLIKKKCINEADLIFAISENTKNDLIKIYDINPSKIKVVYLGFKSFPKLSSSFEMNSKILQTPFILFVGQRSGYKNFDGFIEAYNSSIFLKNNYNIISFGGGVFSDEELNIFDKYNINEKIFHLKGGDDVLKSCYENASVFIYPSKYEGFGIPPLEAMSCGTPVCCSNVSSIPEIVKNAAVFFDPTKEKEIANALKSVLKSEITKKDLILKGKKRLNFFTWEKSCDDSLTAYKSLL